MTSGSYFMARGWMKNPVFKNEPYTEREAWLWIIENASYKPRRQRVASAVVDVVRGEFSASLRFMAVEWAWNEPRVRRYLERLKNDAMIDARIDAGVTVIFVTNYETYQAPLAPIDAPIDGPIDAASTQHRRSIDAASTQYKEKEGNKGRKEESKNPPMPPRRSPRGGADTSEFVAFWEEYPHKIGKPEARKVFGRALAKADISTILQGVRRYIASKPSDRSWCNPSTFLNQERWADEPAKEPTNGRLPGINGHGGGYGWDGIPLSQQRKPSGPPPEI